MNPAGELVVRIAWDGQRATAVDVDLARPQAAGLLVGKTAGEALAWVPRLFSICGHAQSEAARAALSAAGAPWAAGGAGGDAVLVEAAQEHLWRLLRDWPAALGLLPREHDFAAWYRRLAALQAQPLPAAGLPELLSFVEDLVGPAFEALVSFARDLPAFARDRGAHGAALLGALPAAIGEGPAPRFLDRSFPLAELPCPLDAGDGAFVERPTLGGAPAETGALARQRRQPLVADGLGSQGATLAVRLAARLHDALAVARALARRPSTWREGQLVSSATIGQGVGLARVDTARGVLLHYARLDGVGVADYAIVAPTAWNFHPRGALAAALSRLVAGDEAALRAAVTRWVVALDPCVAWRMEVGRA